MQENISRAPVFVFGSNLAGRHGKGDALIALNRWGAVYSQGEGLQGDCYGVPTKDANIRTRALIEILPAVRRFVAFAIANPALDFEVQALGCRLAGYEPQHIAPMFQGAPKNCYFHPVFTVVLRAQGELVNELPAPRAPVLQQQQTLF